MSDELTARRTNLAEAGATAIRNRIQQERLEPGTLLGSQNDLIDAMHLSRGTGLEALELLTHQGVVEMRRGRGGGCFVARPGAATVVRSVSTFLAFDEVALKELIAARIVIEPSLARFAATRPGRIRMARELDAINAASQNSMSDVAEFDQLCAQFHVALARGSGNRPLGLFAEVLQELTQSERLLRRYKNSPPEIPQRVHEKIAQAIRTGDGELAETLMIRHLEATGRVGRKAAT